MIASIHVLVSFLLIFFPASVLAQQKPSIQRFEGTREMRMVEPAMPFMTAASDYIASCGSSTPLRAGFGAAPVMRMLEFRDLVASRPITVIRLGKALRVPDRSGFKGDPALELVEITLIQMGNDVIRVFAHAGMEGHLVEFRDPSKDAESKLRDLIRTSQAPRASPSDGDKPSK